MTYWACLVPFSSSCLCREASARPNRRPAIRIPAADLTDVRKASSDRNTGLLTFASMAGGLAAYGFWRSTRPYLRTELHLWIEGYYGTAASMYGVSPPREIVCGYMAGSHRPEIGITIAALSVFAATSYLIFNVATSLDLQRLLSAVQGAAFSRLPVRQQFSLMQRSVRTPLIGRASGLMLAAVEHCGGRFRLRDGQIGLLARMEHGIRSADDAADRGSRPWQCCSSPRQTRQAAPGRLLRHRRQSPWRESLPPLDYRRPGLAAGVRLRLVPPAAWGAARNSTLSLFSDPRECHNDPSLTVSRRATPRSGEVPGMEFRRPFAISPPIGSGRLHSHRGRPASCVRRPSAARSPSSSMNCVLRSSTAAAQGMKLTPAGESCCRSSTP